MANQNGLKATQLREYALALKCLKQEEIATIADLHARSPARLIGRIRESIKTVDAYPVIDEPYVPAGRKQSSAPTTRIKNGHDFAAHVLDRKKWTVSGAAALGFKPIAREVSTLRSTVGPRAARRSIDLVLANAQDHTLIIGEVKIGNDTTAYEALIQSLVYLVEMTSSDQRDRAANHLDTRLRTAPAPAADIYLICFRPPERSTFRGMIDTSTRVVAERLLDDPTVRLRVRRIAYLDAVLEDSGLHFTSRYAFGPGV